MNKLDPHTLFSIFEQGDEQIYKENNVEELLDNPYVLIGMVVTGIENFYLMDQMYSSKHPRTYKRVRHKIKFKYYTKLFKYLDRTTPAEVGKLYNIGSDYEIDIALKAINELLFFFEDIEHYEKCSIIKLYSDLLIGKKLETLI